MHILEMKEELKKKQREIEENKKNFHWWPTYLGIVLAIVLCVLSYVECRLILSGNESWLTNAMQTQEVRLSVFGQYLLVTLTILFTLHSVVTKFVNRNFLQTKNRLGGELAKIQEMIRKEEMMDGMCEAIGEGMRKFGS